MDRVKLLTGLCEELRTISGDYQFIACTNTNSMFAPGWIVYFDKDVKVSIHFFRPSGSRQTLLRFNTDFPGVGFRKDGWTASMEDLSTRVHEKTMELVKKVHDLKYAHTKRQDNEVTVVELAKAEFKSRATHIEPINNAAKVSLIVGNNPVHDPRLDVKVQNLQGKLQVKIQESAWLSLDQFNRIMEILKETKPEIVQELIERQAA